MKRTMISICLALVLFCSGVATTETIGGCEVTN